METNKFNGINSDTRKKVEGEPTRFTQSDALEPKRPFVNHIMMDRLVTQRRADYDQRLKVIWSGKIDFNN